MRNVLDIEFYDMNGEPRTLRELGDATTENWLVVNVASACGLTRHYSGLQDVSTKDGITVVGFPCNQFAGQEPGTHEEICQFTSDKFGVTFPLMAIVEVNGANQAELFRVLTEVTGVDGHVGPIRWNFEKFVIDSDGNVNRYAPQTLAEDIL